MGCRTMEELDGTRLNRPLLIVEVLGGLGGWVGWMVQLGVGITVRHTETWVSHAVIYFIMATCG